MAEEKSVEINLNLGSGSKPYLDYRNCDKYPGPGVDEVFDMNKIPYPNNSVTTIHSEHALEHLDHYRARTCIEEWFRVLKPGGKIHLQMPDLDECCMQFVISCRSNNRPAMEWFRYTIYGLEKGLSPNEPAEAQFHSTGFSLEEIKEEFSKIGFIIVNAQRYNGYNTPSIEIEVMKPNEIGVNKLADKVIVDIASTQRDVQQETNFNFIQTCPFPRFIYSSSPDRGLDTLLYLWQFIRREFPQATLHVLYGFNNWNKAIDQRNNEQEKKWRDQIMKDMNQSGVHYYGRVDQNTVAKMYQSADIWFYPSKFTETFCITALEAQISKTVIVCTDLAALHTTVGDRGILIQGDAYTKEYREKALQEVFAILKDEKRRKEMVEKAYEWAKQQTWDARAKEMLNITGLIK